MSEQDQYFETNKAFWNASTKLHVDSPIYELADFRNGGLSLRELEQQEVGEVRGKKLLHLQCHFGMDTMSWSRLGAEATGMDISDEGIKEARRIAGELGLDTTFVCCNIYDLPQHLEGQFDIVFTSYGVLGWLPDLDKWAKVVNHFLKPGGTFYIAEFHPFIWLYDDKFEDIKYSYFNTGPDYELTENTYGDRDANLSMGNYYWSHPLGAVSNALIKQGLQIEFIHEWDYINWNCIQGLEEIGKYRYILPKWGHKIPYMYSLKATRSKS